MLFLWFYHACRKDSPRFLMVADHINYLTFEDPGAVNTLRRALKLAHAGDLYGAAETAGVDVAHASVVSEALRRGMRFSIGAEVDNDPRSRPDAQNIVDAMRPDGLVRTVNFVTIEHPEKGADWAWPFDNEEFAHFHDAVGPEKLWELYSAKLFDDLEKLPAHIVGHFYGPASFGHWPAQKQLEEYEDRLLTICHARGLAVEVNTRFLYRDNSDDLKKKYLEANARLVRKAKALGVGIAIGSDAHSPKDQGNAFDVVLKMLDEAKINEVVFPVGGRLARVALRATREHLEAQAKTRDTHSPGSSITGLSRAELGLPEQAELSASARRENVRAAREAAAASKKRSSSSARAGKRAEAAAAKSTSKRSAESSSSSSKAKATRAVKPPATPPKPVPPKPASKAAPKKAAVKPSKPVKSAKPVAKPAKTAKPAKPAAKVKSLRPAPKPVKSVRPAGKKAAAVKPAAKKTVAAAKRAPAPKKPTPKPAAKSKKPAAARAHKPPAKKAVKKAVKSPSKGSATKKKPTPKRR
jgi:HisJ family histidinol phosphate phosphatase